MKPESYIEFQIGESLTDAAEPLPADWVRAFKNVVGAALRHADQELREPFEPMRMLAHELSQDDMADVLEQSDFGRLMRFLNRFAHAVNHGLRDLGRDMPRAYAVRLLREGLSRSQEDSIVIPRRILSWGRTDEGST